MKVLLDENLPHALRPLLRGHDVFTVAYMGWSGISNGQLLRRVEDEGFDVLITLDSGVPYQQNLAERDMLILVLCAPSSDISDLQPLVPAILKHLAMSPRPADVLWVGQSDGEAGK